MDPQSPDHVFTQRTLSTLVGMTFQVMVVEEMVTLASSHDRYCLTVYSKWAIDSGKDTLDEFLGSPHVLATVHCTAEVTRLTFADGSHVSVDMTDDGYVCPEVMLMATPWDHIVWN